MTGAPVPPKLPENSRRWRRKTWEELQSDRRRRRRQELNPLGPLLLAVFGATFWTAMRVLVGMPRHRRPPVPLAQGLAELPFVLVVLFLVLYIRQAVFRAGIPRARLTICTRCYDIGVRKRTNTCACGGELENADRWTYNRCASCGYDLAGNVSGVCPECGLEAR